MVRRRTGSRWRSQGRLRGAREALFPSRDGPDRVVVLARASAGPSPFTRSPDRRARTASGFSSSESAFSSYRRIAREKLDSFWLTWPFQYPLSWTVSDSYRAEQWIGQVTPVPVLILHGMNDPVVPTHHGRRLFEAAREPKQFWLTATPGHIMSFADGKVRGQLAAFLRTALTVTARER